MMTRCCICGDTAAGTHDPTTGKWYCLKPECVKQTPKRLFAGRGDGKPVNPADHAPEAVRLHQHVQALGERDNASGDITHGRGFVGVDEFGKRPDGAVDAFWRPPSYAAPRDGRRDLPVKMNGRTRYQQSPPTHVSGAVYGNEREVRRHEKRIGEEQAQRKNLCLALDAVAGDVTQLPPDQMAAALAMNRAQERKVKRGMRARAK